MVTWNSKEVGSTGQIDNNWWWKPDISHDKMLKIFTLLLQLNGNIFNLWCLAAAALYITFLQCQCSSL